jgi:peptidoglycan/LPS O-acetylase OafA/YrhL
MDPDFGKMKFSWMTYSLFHGFSDKYNLDGIAQAWSLNIEMTFYVIAPLLCLLQKKHLTWLIGFLGILFIGTWAIGAWWHHLNGNPGRWLYPFKFVTQGTFPGRSMEFLAGMILAYYIRNKKTISIEKFRFKTSIGFAGIFITAYCIGLFQPDQFHHGFDHPADFFYFVS